MNEAPLPEPLDQFLEHPPTLRPDADVRESILRMTSNRMPTKRWPRWPFVFVGAAAMVAFVFLAGSYWLLRSIRIAAPPMAAPDLVEREVAPRDVPEPPRPPEIMVKTPPSPRDLEWRAFDAEEDATRVQLYFEAGNLYLDRFDDVQSALRCYRQAIHHADAEGLEVNPNDNWLVMALKRDHRKEK